MPDVDMRSARTLRNRAGAPIRPQKQRFTFFIFPLLALLAATLAPERASAADDSQTDSLQAVDVVFVLDNSGSMRQNDPQYLTRQAVADFARSLGQADRVDARIGVVLFDGAARLVQPLAKIEPERVDAMLGDAMTALDFSGQHTNSPAGIERALYELRENGREAGRRAIVFLSDGQIDTGDAQSDYDASWWLREELADESRALGIRIFSIAFTDAADYQLMQALAQKTRASYYRAYQADELTGVVADVLDKVAEGEFYALAATNAGPVTPFANGQATSPTNIRNGETSPSAALGQPDVASAPRATPLDLGSPAGILAWMPVAVFLIAGTLLWRHQKPVQSVDALIAQAELDMDAPAAQLLDFGGQLGETGTALPLRRGRNRIGRDKHNDIILDDDTISSEHAVIEVHDGRYWVEDRRSTNGTRIGDKRISPEQRVPLKGGDHIRFADIDLMFVLAGYVPGGATVFLDSSTTPPLGWRNQKQPSAQRPPTTPPAEKPSEPAAASSRAARPPSKSSAEPPPADSQPVAVQSQSEDIAIASERERVDPAPVENLDAALVEAEPAADTAPAEPTDPYRECLDYHLARVEEISTAFEEFIGEAFDPEIRDAIAITARGLIKEAQGTESVSLCHKDYTSGAIRYVTCGIVGEMETARECYIETFGGFTRMLTEQLQSESFRRDRCQILAVLTFGQSRGDGTPPWVSLSVVPDEGQDPRIDLLSYEFLTAEERREMEPTEHPGDEAGWSQSGLG